MKKLQLEFDCFFLRAVLCIFSSRRLGAWQYLASLPYDLISSNTLWQIFYILHTDCMQIDMHVSNRSTHGMYSFLTKIKIFEIENYNKNINFDIMLIILKIG